MKALSIISHALDAKNYGNFDKLDQAGNSFGQMLSSAIHFVQQWIWIPVGFVGLLAVVCFIGNRRGKEWAAGKIKDIVIVLACIIFFVYILTAILQAFGYGTAIDKMQSIIGS